MRVKRDMNLGKAVGYSIAVNAIQVALALAVAIFSIVSGGHAFSGLMEQLLLCGVAVVVSWGAALDIREAMRARAMGEEAGMLEQAYDRLEQLNGTLRAQRHDFMNHLQVVFSLMELGEHEEAGAYIEKVYGDIQKVGRTLKTAHPAINALLAAKISDCEARGIAVDLAIDSAWQLLPVDGWAMCRVLSNLIDNALDALRGISEPRLSIRMCEDLHAFSFEIANNGPMIPQNLRGRIFQRGFSTKQADRGMGLAIVSDIIREHGGRIELSSDAERTAFTGSIPKPVEGVARA